MKVAIFFFLWITNVKLSHLYNSIDENQQKSGVFTPNQPVFHSSMVLKLNVLIEKELPISLLQMYKMNIEYVLNHFNTILTQENTVKTNGKDSFRFEINNILSFKQYKRIKRYKDLANLVATEKVHERVEVLMNILPGEITIMCYYQGTSPYVTESEINERIDFNNGTCDAITLVPIKYDPLLTIFRGIERLMSTNFTLPNIFKESYYESETELLSLNKDLDLDMSQLRSVFADISNCYCKYNDCTTPNISNFILPESKPYELTPPKPNLSDGLTANNSNDRLKSNFSSILKNYNTERTPEKPKNNDEKTSKNSKKNTKETEKSKLFASFFSSKGKSMSKNSSKPKNNQSPNGFTQPVRFQSFQEAMGQRR